MPTPLHAETLLIEGPDALTFAHAQFSSNVLALAVNTWQFSAWLDAQGRVRALFQLARLDEHRLLLLLRGGEAATLAEALRRYVFRGKLSLQASTGQTLTSAAALPLHAVHHEANGIVLGGDTHSLRLGNSDAGDDAWRGAQIELGWPWLPAVALDSLLPPALSLYRLQAVAVDKGCYPGQEIVARLHWRGGHKRHLCLLRAPDVLAPGTVLHRDGREVGMLLDSSERDQQFHALAVLSDDIALHAAIDAPLTFDNTTTLALRARWGN